MCAEQSNFWTEPEPAGSGSRDPDPEGFARRLAERLGERLVSVVLHGPGTPDDGSGAPPEHKLLVVVEPLGVTELEEAGPLVREWLSTGQPVPLIFSEARLARSAASYPVELLDMKEGHRLLHGRDLISGLEVRKQNLLLDIERGFKSQLHRICEAHMRQEGKKSGFHAVLHREQPRLSLLLRSILRLFVARGPSTVVEVLTGLDRHCPGVRAGFLPFYAFLWQREVEGMKPPPNSRELLAAAIPAYDRLIATVEDLRLRDAGNA